MERVASRFGPASAHGTRERHHLHSASAAATQRGCSRRRRGAARIDVVDQADARGRRPCGGERTCDVPAPLFQAEPALALDRPQPSDEARDRQLPRASELPRESLRRTVSPLQRPLGVRGHEGERGDVGARQRLDDQGSSRARQPPLTPLLPRLDEAPGACVVDDRGPRRREGDPPSAAFRAPLDRPRTGCAAAGAERRREPDQRVAAVEAKCGTWELAGGTPLRQKHVQQHPVNARRSPVPEASRLCVSFVKKHRPRRAGSRQSRCRTRSREPARCRRPPAGRATG